MGDSERSSVDEQSPVSGDPARRDDVFTALRSRARRTVLSELSMAGGSLPTTELAHRLAADEKGPADRETAHLELHHAHVPVLERAGLVRAERNEDILTLTDEGAAVLSLVEAMAATE